jgi:hypothetical protein
MQSTMGNYRQSLSVRYTCQKIIHKISTSAVLMQVSGLVPFFPAAHLSFIKQTELVGFLEDYNPDRSSQARRINS